MKERGFIHFFLFRAALGNLQQLLEHKELREPVRQKSLDVLDRVFEGRRQNCENVHSKQR